MNKPTNLEKERSYRVVKLLALLNSSLELLTSLPSKDPYYSQRIKNRINALEKDLEMYLSQHIDLMYDTNEEYFTAIQNSVDIILKRELSTLVREGLSEKNNVKNE